MGVTLRNPIGPIGDHVGTVPATIALAESLRARGEHLTMLYEPCIEGLVRLLPKRLEIEIAPNDGRPADFTYNLHMAFSICGAEGWYQTRYYFREVGLPDPGGSVRPEFELDESARVAINADWGLAPFARCLPPDQRWPQERWQQLVRSLPHQRFVLYGQAGVDDPNYVTGPNVVPFFGYSLEQVLLSLRDLRAGLVSVSTGPSHLAYAVGAYNVLLINQGPFCKNPESRTIDTYIPEMTVDEVLAVMAQRTSLLEAIA